MTAHRRIAALALILTVAAAAAAEGTPRLRRAFVAKYPAAKEKLGTCATCHTGRLPELNPFGRDLEKAGGDFAAVDSLDSDGDGVLNEVEILALAPPGVPNAKPASKGQAAADSGAAGKPAKSEKK